MNKVKKVLKAPARYREYQRLAARYKDELDELTVLHERFKTQFEPGHFYSPYPSLEEMEKRKKHIFDRSRREISGIDIREKQQLDLLKVIKNCYKDLPYSNRKDPALIGGGY